MIQKALDSLKKQRRRYLAGRPASRWPLWERVRQVRRLYERGEGRAPDLLAPALFTEKIAWYKLFYRHPDMTRLYDKYLFKGYIEEKLGPGHTAPLYGMWTDARELARDWDSLPEAFCLKSNCSSLGKNIVFVHDRKSVDLTALLRQAMGWLDPMNTGINSCNGAYRKVTPRIIAEKLLPARGEQLYDYKVLCFGGKPTYIACISDRFVEGEDTSESFYDTEWNKLPAVRRGRRNKDYERPPHLQQMLEIAAELSKDFPQIRVDFYDAADGLYVGELTLYAGFEFESREWDRVFGEKFILPKSVFWDTLRLLRGGSGR